MSAIANISPDITPKIHMNRRTFISRSLASGSALILSCALPGCSREDAATPAAQDNIQGNIQNGADESELTAFIVLDTQGQITILSPFVEMGQGIYTSIASLVAEELDADMADVKVMQAPHGPAYRIMFDNTMRFTGGSRSLRSAFVPLREAGAAARSMLLRAAAEQLQVDVGGLVTEQSQVIEPASGRKLGYGELAARAAQLPMPIDITLKTPADYRLLGQPNDRVDVPAKTNGQARFGIDQQQPGLLSAAVSQAPVFDGEVDTLDAGPVMGMPGVVAVEQILHGVAVIADHYWHAKSALNTLPVAFKGGIDSGFSSPTYLSKLQARLDEPGETVEQHGDIAAAFAEAATTITATYHTPFLAHATMEPMNCTALVDDDSCTVWAPNQGVDAVVEIAGQITGLAPAQITVHTPYLGGGFGRRFINDYAVQALTLAARHKGKPIKVIWSREEDMQHDHYRPMTAARYRAALAADGSLIALHTTTVGDGPMRRHFGARIGEDNIDPSVIEGVTEQGYAIANRQHDYVYEPSPAPLGFWRSVGNSHNAFFNECFIDEVAAATNTDPLVLRQRLLAGNARFTKVLQRAADMADWRAAPYTNAQGRQCAMGIAIHHAYQTIACQVAEVSVDAAGQPEVHKVWCSVDCGFAVNPNIVTMQIESGIVYGLSAALHETVKMEQGRAVNGNFDDYPILTAQEMPEVGVEIINSGEALGGIGEPGTPPIAPAVCNALFTLTGKRIRSLPIGHIA